jgi:nicotinamide-nucleotide amidase
MKKMTIKSVVKNLIVRKKTIATMESCTGGFIASSITNVEGASNILKFSAVTYSNEFKIKMGVDPEIIDKYSVYSAETAKDMSKKISDYTNSDYGVGVTGKLKRADENNLHGEDNKVFISLYDKDNNKYYEEEVIVTKNTRLANKKIILDKFVEMYNRVGK